MVSIHSTSTPPSLQGLRLLGEGGDASSWEMAPSGTKISPVGPIEPRDHDRPAGAVGLGAGIRRRRPY